MSGVDFSIGMATAADGEEIQAFLGRNPVPGTIPVSYRYAPNYFQSGGTLGEQSEVMLARQRQSGEIVATASRSLRRLYVNSEPEIVGYLGHLRVAKEFRSAWMLATGFRYLRQLHGDGRAEGYLTTIVANNSAAKKVLVQKTRPGFPHYEPLVRLKTLAFPVRPSEERLAADVSVAAAAPHELAEVAAFLNVTGAQRQFFPCLSAADLNGTSGQYPGLECAHILVARRGGAVVGCIGVWNPGRHKEIIVGSDEPSSGGDLPVFNHLGRLPGQPTLPPTGTPMAYAMICFPCVGAQEIAVWPYLLQAALHQARRRGLDYLLLGLTTLDPLLPLAEAWPHIVYESDIYTVGWDQSRNFHERVRHRIPHLELSGL